VNLIEDDDVVLIACAGIWGTRAENMSKRLNANVKMLQKEAGEQMSLQETRDCFRKHKPKVFFMVHGESSTGMLQQNLEAYGDLCREFDCLFIVDSVITLGCTPIFVDKWKIDVAYTGTQKVAINFVVN
jgi:alanine-glyoxylate transaminase/serine-glyoxylate transaminase/serine-pyruvate transaminase